MAGKRRGWLSVAVWLLLAVQLSLAEGATAGGSSEEDRGAAWAIRAQDSGEDDGRGDGNGDGDLHDNPAVCISACEMAVRLPTFNDTPTADEDGGGRGRRKARECSSRLLTTSLFLCFRVHCAGHHTAESIDRTNHTCAVNGPGPLPAYEAVMANFSDAAVARLRRLQPAEAVPDTLLDEVVVPSRRLYEVAYDTLDYWSYVRKYHAYYSLVMLHFWFFVVLLGVAVRLGSFALHVVRRLRRSRRLRGRRYQPLYGNRVDNVDDLDIDIDIDDEAAVVKGTARPARPRLWLKRYLTLPATFGTRCSQDFGWFTVPPRIQSLTIALFAVVNVVGCVHGYKTFEGNLYYPYVSWQLYRYVSDRTGTLSYINFPLIWMFGMRNNLLAWLTGWDFGTFNNFHRWVARIATVQAIVHSVGYTMLVCREGGWESFFSWWSMYFWWTGGVATISMSLLLGASFYYVRRRMYEVFLIVHIGLSIFVLLGMLGHISIFPPHVSSFVYICAVIWVSDRVLRVLRILAFNPLFWRTRAKATYDPQANIIRLVVPYTSSLYRPRPGTYYYIHVLNDSRFWESHPFTVASVASAAPAASRPRKRLSQQSYVELSDQDQDQDQDQDRSDNEAALPKIFPGPREGPGPEPHEASVLLSDSDSSVCSRYRNGVVTASADNLPLKQASVMTFLIRPYDSFTARLRDMAHPGPTPLRVLVDGPYGHAQRFDDFATVLFVVGGSGIVVPLSHLSGRAAAEAVAAAAATTTTTSTTPRSVRIVWAVREAALAADVVRQDFREVLQTGLVALDIYVTHPGPKPQPPATVDDDTDSSDDTTRGDVDVDIGSPSAPPLAGPLPKHVRVFYDRPDVRGEVECAAQTTAAGSVAVVACGPGRMADEARRTVVDLLGRRGTGDIEYFEESFQW